MNDICKVVWSHARQQFVVVSEIVSSACKAKSSQAASPASKHSVRPAHTLAPRLNALSLAVACAILAPTVSAQTTTANTLPTGGQVVAGQGSIQTQGSVMTVNQTSNRMALDWQSFNIGAGQTVNFVQPGAQATALNRVLGSDVSTIQGQINANGRVYLLNPNGVLFTPTAQVNVGSLVASTLGMSNADFMAGNDRLAGDSAQAVTHQGQIRTTPGGTVALVAARVINAGEISAPSGSVLLAAGRKVRLDLGGPAQIEVEEGSLNAVIAQTGSIRATDGMVYLTAKAASQLSSSAINHSGVIEANSLSSKGGLVILEADNIHLSAGSRIDATGALGGGAVLVGGDWQGSGTLRQSTTVTADSGSVIDASATVKGDGGKVVLWSDVHNSQSLTTANGALYARGGVGGGNGGRIETSGAQLNTGSVQVDASATHGQAGLWLIDPYDYTIGSTEATNIVNALNTGASGTSVEVNTGSSVVNYGGSASTGSGNITVSSAISANTAFTSANLSLIADGKIDVNAAVTVGGKLLLKAAGNVTVASNLTTNGNDITLWSDSDASGRGGINVKDNVTLDSRTAADRTAVNIGTATGGGRITLGGGLDDGGVASGSALLRATGMTAGDGIPDGYASNYAPSGSGLSVINYGIGLGTITPSAGHNSNLKMYSGSGEIRIQGQISELSTNTGNWPTAVLAHAGFDINAGSTGGITMFGVTSLGSGTIGFDLQAWRENNTGTLTSKILTNNGDINIISRVSSAYSGSLGIAIDGNAQSGKVVRALIGATGTGSITLNGSMSGSNGTADMRLTSVDILANGGDINFLSTGSGFQVSNYMGDGLVVGSKAGSIITSSTSNVLVQADKVTVNQPFVINTTGHLTVQPNSTSFSSALNWGTNITLGNTLTAMTLGKSGNTSDINFGVTQTVNGPVNMYGGNIAINAPLTATNDTITLQGAAGGNVTDGSSGYLVADKLLLLGGNVALDHASNNVSTLAASGVTGLKYWNSNALTIGSVGATPTNGISATGAVNVQTLTGDLTVAQSVSTTNASSSAMLLNAGQSASPVASPGSATGGNLLLSGTPSLTAGAGGTIKLYTGEIGVSNGPESLVAQGQGRFRYHADETTNFATGSWTNLGTGTYVVYRAQPSVAMSNGGVYTMTYGDPMPMISTTGSTVNGDISTADVNNRVNSSSGNIKASSVAYSISSNLVGLGYDVTGLASGSLTVNPRDVTAITGIAAQNKTYDNSYGAALTTGGAGFTGKVTGDTLAVASSTGTFSDKNVANNIPVSITGLTLGGTDASNYNLTTNTASSSANITARPITVTANSGQTKVYGNADPTLTYTLEANSAGHGLVVGDTFSGALSRASGENVGSSYAITQGTLTNSNYAISFTGANFAITQRPITVAIDAKTKVYGNTDPTLTYSLSSGNLVGGDALTLSRVVGENVGSYAISAANGNYAITANSANLSITARPITITANSGQSKVYGNTDPTLTYTLEANSAGRGLVGSDAFSGALGRASGENVGSSYAITQGTLANSNYAISLAAGGSFAITQRPITVVIDAKSKVYGNTDPTLSYSITSGNLFGSDALTLSRVSGENVGSYAISAVNSNYAITANSANLGITARPIIVTANSGLTKVYGNADPTLSYTLEANSSGRGLVGSDTFSGALSRTSGENVASSYTITQGTLANSNYAISLAAGGSFAITQRPITLAMDAKNKRSGDPDPSWTYQLTNGNLVTGDALTLSRVTGDAPGLYLISAANPNYLITATNAYLTVLPKAESPTLVNGLLTVAPVQPASQPSSAPAVTPQKVVVNASNELANPLPTVQASNGLMLIPVAHEQVRALTEDSTSRSADTNANASAKPVAWLQSAQTLGYTGVLVVEGGVNLPAGIR